MTTLVVGASGATGRLLVDQLLALGEAVRMIVRSVDAIPDAVRQNPLVTISEANLLEMTEAELLAQVKDCRAVASCLGHNLDLKGMFGHPRRLVTDAVKRLCAAIEKSAPDTPVKFVLMNTTGNQNQSAGEEVSLMQSLVVGLIRVTLPPHADNEQAAAYLQSGCSSRQSHIEWVAVRPDTLVDEALPTNYQVYRSPICSAIFDSGKTSRINVAHFMSQLIVNDDTWQQWKRQMPVIYNVPA